MGAVEGGTASVSLYIGTGLYNGTEPETVELSLTSSWKGAHLVQMMTEFGYGSPEATPCVKFKLAAFGGAEPALRLLTLWIETPKAG